MTDEVLSDEDGRGDFLPCHQSPGGFSRHSNDSVLTISSSSDFSISSGWDTESEKLDVINAKSPKMTDEVLSDEDGRGDFLPCHQSPGGFSRHSNDSVITISSSSDFSISNGWDTESEKLDVINAKVEVKPDEEKSWPFSHEILRSGSQQAILMPGFDVNCLDNSSDCDILLHTSSRGQKRKGRIVKGALSPKPGESKRQKKCMHRELEQPVVVKMEEDDDDAHVCQVTESSLANLDIAVDVESDSYASQHPTVKRFKTFLKKEECLNTTLITGTEDHFRVRGSTKSCDGSIISISSESEFDSLCDSDSDHSICVVEEEGLSDTLPDLDDRHPLSSPQKIQAKSKLDGVDQRLCSSRISESSVCDSISVFSQTSTCLPYHQSSSFNHHITQSSSSLTLPATDPSSVKRRILRYKSRVPFLKSLFFFPSALCMNQTRDISMVHKSILENLSVDCCNLDGFRICMHWLENASVNRRPPSDLFEKLIKSTFFSVVGDDKIPVVFRNILLRLWHQYPESVSLNQDHLMTAGDVIQHYLQPISSPIDCNTPMSSFAAWPSILQARLYFQIFLEGLQLSLSQCVLADPRSVSRSLAFSILSTDVGTFKTVTRWIRVCLLVQQPSQMEVAKEWLASLQALLSVVVLVSRDRQEAAKRVAEELRCCYTFLTDLSAKKLLLQTLQCPLVAFYLVRLIMENECQGAVHSRAFPTSVVDVAENYFDAMPPQNHTSTPPPSPPLDDPELKQKTLCPLACEELSVLVLHVTKSYLACRQKGLHGDLRAQVLKTSSVQILSAHEREEILSKVQDFATRLHGLSKDLTPSTLLNLKLLESLCCTF